MMMGSIYLFGLLALPFAGLSGNSYAHLHALSTLYILLTVVSGMYTVVEASYVPIFMRSVGWVRSPTRVSVVQGHEIEESYRKAWIKGSRVSVLGLVSSNVGALVALLIGVVITYTRGSYVQKGYARYIHGGGGISPGVSSKADNRLQFLACHHNWWLFDQWAESSCPSMEIGSQADNSTHSLLRDRRSISAAKHSWKRTPPGKENFTSTISNM